MAFCTRFADQNCEICTIIKLGALPTVAAGSAPPRKINGTRLNRVPLVIELHLRGISIAFIPDLSIFAEVIDRGQELKGALPDVQVTGNFTLAGAGVFAQVGENFLFHYSFSSSSKVLKVCLFPAGGADAGDEHFPLVGAEIGKSVLGELTVLPVPVVSFIDFDFIGVAAEGADGDDADFLVVDFLFHFYFLSFFIL